MARLDLNPDQRKKLERLKLNHQKEAIPLFSRIRMAGVETEIQLLGDPVNLDEIKQLGKEKHAAVAELEFSHILLTQRIKALLTPEQKEKLESMMMGMGPQMGMEKMGMGMMGGPSGKGKAEAGDGEKEARRPRIL